VAQKGKSLPPPVVRRLTRYLTHMQSLVEEGVEWVSSEELGEALGLGSSTVRQDISHLDYSGISKRGYETAILGKVLAKVLDADTEVNVIVVGAGNLGRALSLHGEFAASGFRICGIFDSDPKVVGRKIGSSRVKPMGELAATVRSRRVTIGMIAVPAASAQSVADVMVAAGVKGLLNLASAHILVPKSVAVVDARIVASLRELLYAIKVRRETA
jgi:redox-sensing transcriptional repressor